MNSAVARVNRNDVRTHAGLNDFTSCFDAGVFY